MCIYESHIFMPPKHDLPMPCDLAALACKTPYKVSCMPHTFESPTFVHYYPLFELRDLEISAYNIDDPQVHAPCVSSVETPIISLGHFDMRLTTPTHAHVDACDTLPLVGHIMTYVDLCHDIPIDCLSFPFTCFFFNF